jgi:hypothetical protein
MFASNWRLDGSMAVVRDDEVPVYTLVRLLPGLDDWKGQCLQRWHKDCLTECILHHHHNQPAGPDHSWIHLHRDCHCTVRSLETW